MYIYPDNLTSKPSLWFWTLRDITIIGVATLFSVLAFTQTGILLPLVMTATYAFLSIRFDDVCVIDFICFAAKFFFAQQRFEWGESNDS